MAVDLKKFEQLKSKADKLERDKARAEGALAQTLKRIEDEFGCRSLAEAERLLKQMEKEAEAAEQAYNKAMDEFEAEWGEELGR